MGVDTLDDLTAALAALSHGVVLPEGDLRASRQARDLFDAVDAHVAARKFQYVGEMDEAYSMVDDQYAKASGAERTLLAFALMRRRDKTFLNHGADGLTCSEPTSQGSSRHSPSTRSNSSRLKMPWFHNP